MTAVLFISMVILLFAGVPIAFVLGGSSVLALAADSGTNMSIVIQRMFSGTGSFTLLAIPFFVLAGNLMSSGGISRRLVNLCNSFLGHIPGGLAMVAVATCAFFAAISGSSAATAAAVGAIIVPEMLKHKYDRNFAARCCGAGACNCQVRQQNYACLRQSAGKRQADHPEYDRHYGFPCGCDRCRAGRACRRPA